MDGAIVLKAVGSITAISPTSLLFGRRGPHYEKGTFLKTLVLAQITDSMIHYKTCAYKVMLGVCTNEQNKGCLISLLSAILSIHIKDLTLQNTNQPADFDGEKNARLDVLAELDNQVFVNIEVQVENHRDVGKRSLFYWARLFAGQCIAGKPYNVLKPVYTIFILDFKVFKEHEKFASTFVLKNRESNDVFFPEKNMLEMHFLEIPKFKDLKTIPTTHLEKWMLFFRSKNNETLEELKMSDPILERAVTEIELAKMSKAERNAYESRMFALSDIASILKIFEKLAKKRFPKMSKKTHAKIVMFSDDQINQQMEFILDYKSQKEFEDAIAAIICQ